MQGEMGGPKRCVSNHTPPAAHRQNPQPPSPARLPGAALTPKPDVGQPLKFPASQPVAQPKAHSRRATKAIFALLAVAVLMALGVVRQRRIWSAALDPGQTLNVTLSTPTTVTPPPAVTSAEPSMPAPSSGSTTATVPASNPKPSLPASLPASLEDQQRHLI